MTLVTLVARARRSRLGQWLGRGLAAGAALGGVWMMASVVLGCDGGARREAEAVVQAVERFRRADNPQKPAMAEALRGTPCSAADVCRARDACLASAEATAKAMRLKSEVESGLAALEKGALARDSESAMALPQKLDDAEALLKEGFQRLPACDDQVMELKRVYRF